MKIRSYKYRLSPTKVQKQEIQNQFYYAKNLWNEGRSLAKQIYSDFGRFPTLQTYQLISKNSGLHSQSAQDVLRRLDKGIKGMLTRKKKGLRAGFPRFKSVDRIKSITYPQFGFGFKKNNLVVSKIGSITIRKHRKLKGKIKILTLKREAGKYYAILTTEQETPTPKVNAGRQIGADFGLTTFATFSNGNKLKKPKHYKKHVERLKAKQRTLSRKKRRSKNSRNAKQRLSKIHVKIRDIRKDWLHKTANHLLLNYSLIALEDLDMQGIAEEHGKGVSDAGWAIFTNILCYKAEEAGCEVRFVNPKGTTKECSNCGRTIEKTLQERHHNCPCGLSIDRDHNAAINILNRATGGAPESNACGGSWDANSNESGTFSQRGEANPS